MPLEAWERNHAWVSFQRLKPPKLWLSFSMPLKMKVVLDTIHLSTVGSPVNTNGKVGFDHDQKEVQDGIPPGWTKSISHHL